MAISPQRIVDTDFWQLPLDQRMAEFAELREQGPFHRVSFANQYTGEEEAFTAVVSYDELVAISKNPKDFCSGRGATSIVDMPPEMLEYFGGFINMDDPRHAHQRTIVAKTFTPRALQNLLDSVSSTCTEVIDGFCERGEVDLVEVLSQPFPLLVICDMMGIPRSDFDRVLQATNVILGAGDPEFLKGRDPMQAGIEAGIELVTLMNELAEHKRRHPGDDLTSKLVNADFDEQTLTPDELGSFFILLAVAGNDTTRNGITYAVDLLSRYPDQRRILTDDLDAVAPTAVEEIIRVASPVTFMRRSVTHDLTMSGEQLDEGERLILFYGAANRDPQQFADPETFDVTRAPNPHVGFGGPGPHFCLGAHLARREMNVVLRELMTRLPDLEPTGPPVPLEAAGVPLVSGLKRLPVSFTPTAPVGA